MHTTVTVDCHVDIQAAARQATCLMDLIWGWVSRKVMRLGSSCSIGSLVATLAALPTQRFHCETHHPPITAHWCLLQRQEQQSDSGLMG